MNSHKLDRSSTLTPSTLKKNSSALARPVIVQMQQESHSPPDREERENQAFDQMKFEAVGLENKEVLGTITPIQQARLGVLQAKMNDFWVQRTERASRFSINLTQIPAHDPERGAEAPERPRVTIQPLRADGVASSMPPSPRDGWKESVQRAYADRIRQNSLAVQAKLAIGSPNDKYEQEADRVASQVVQQINAPASAQPTQAQSVQRQEEPTEELQAKPEMTARKRQQALGYTPSRLVRLFGPSAAPVQRAKQHTRQVGGSLGPPVKDIDIATLPETKVLPFLANIELYGEVGIPPGSNVEFEPGDKAALELRRDAPTFGNASATTLSDLLTNPSPLLGAVEQGLLDNTVAGRNLATAFPNFVKTFGALRTSSKVVGFGQWAASKVVSAQKLINGGKQAPGQLLDYMSELREVETRIPKLGGGETINIAESAIPGGGTQTADLTQSHGRQIEVKTVRKPIIGFKPVRIQLSDAVKKFDGAGVGGGPYEAVIYASYSAPVKKSTGRGKAAGTTTKWVDMATGDFHEAFVPKPSSKRPASSMLKGNLGKLVLKWLQTSGVAGTDTVNYVRIRIENATGASPFEFQRDLTSGWKEI